MAGLNFIPDLFKAFKDLITDAPNEAQGSNYKKGFSLVNLLTEKDTMKLNASIAKMARKNIAQFPMIMSNTIMEDQALKVCEIVERTIADMLLICLQNSNNLIDLSKDSNAKQKFIERFTNGGKTSIDASSLNRGVLGGMTDSIKSVNVSGIDTFTLKQVANKSMLLEDMPIKSSFEMSVLGIPTLHAEMDNLGTVAPVSAPMGKKKDEAEDDQLAKEAGNQNNILPPAANNNQNNPPKKGDPTIAEGRQRVKYKENSFANIENKVYKLEPTIVKATVLVETNNDTKEASIIFGIKVNAHVVDSEELITAIKDTYSSSSFVTRLLRWRTGELSFFKDVLLNLKEIKRTVAANTGRFSKNNVRGIFASMRFNNSQAMAMNTLAVGGNCLPTVMVLLTLDEAEMIKSTCGKDLIKNTKDARELCEKLGLFGILLLDSSNDTFYSFFNDDSVMYTKSSLKDLKGKNSDDVVKAIFGALKR